MITEPKEPPLREQLLEAAEKCFAQFGVVETKIDDLVRATGIPRATLYRHVGNKERIVHTLTMRRFEKVFAGLLEIARTNPNLGDALVESVLYVIDSAERDELVGAQFVPVALSSQLGAMTEEARAQVVIQLTTFVERFLDLYRPTGQVRADLDPLDAARWVGLAISSLLMLPAVVAPEERRVLLQRMLLPAYLA